MEDNLRILNFGLSANTTCDSSMEHLVVAAVPSTLFTGSPSSSRGFLRLLRAVPIRWKSLGSTYPTRQEIIHLPLIERAPHICIEREPLLEPYHGLLLYIDVIDIILVLKDASVG